MQLECCIHSIMLLSNEHILKFQLLYKEQFGLDISKETAYEECVNLLQLLQIIYKPMTKEEFEQTEKDIEIIQERINKRKTI